MTRGTLFGRIMAGFVMVSFVLLCLSISSPAPAMSVPGGGDAFQFVPLSMPVTSADPLQARPLGLSFRGDLLSVETAFSRFDGPVDLYVGVFSAAVDDKNIYILNGDGRLQPASQGLEPWKAGIREISREIVFDSIQVSSLPPGEYKFYVAVTPAGSQERHFLWETSFDSSPRAVAQHLSALTPLNGCDAVLQSLKDRAVREMEETIFSLTQDVLNYGVCPIPVYFSAGPVPPPAAPVADGGATQYSGTNVQVAGVDEADFVKNDGSLIYIVADGRFQIIDAWPPQESRVIGSQAIEGEPRKLFVSSGKALVYSSLGSIDLSGPYNSPWGSLGAFYPGVPECSYGYDCDFTGDGRKTKISVFDITDPANPVLQRELRLSGSYINARRIGTAVHTVATFPPPSFPGVSYWPDIMNHCWTYGPGAPTRPSVEEVVTALEDLKTTNRLAIENADISDVLPSIEDIRHIDGTTVSTDNILADCRDFSSTVLPDGQSFLSVLSLDMDRNDDVKATTILGRPGAVYATPASLYVAARQHASIPFAPVFGMPEVPKESTVVHKFSIGSNPAANVYTASGSVKGNVLNQFSMDEWDGHFRIASTSGHLPDPRTHSTVSILQETNGELVLAGQVDNIAPGEDIRSARFYGERGFLVTFKKTDPLFSLDLSSPASPKVVGTLKIPGYSTYMHLMDESHLLTIGYDAADQGDFAWFQGIMLQIFDVGDMANPSLMHREVIGTRGTASEAATNHLAFNYFASKGLLAIPATICEGVAGGDMYNTTMTFSGLLVYDVSVRSGFSFKGGVSHVSPLSPQAPQMCGSWWTQPQTVVKRSIFMDDYVYSVAEDKIIVDPVNELGKDISVIELHK